MIANTITATDLRLNARWVIPVEPAGITLEDHAVMIQGDRILAVLPQAEADARFHAREVVDLPHHVVLPGLINLHGHAAMTLFRGLADDLPLMTWLQDHIWPAEGQYVSEQFIADGTRLAMAEMLRTGTTLFSDMYFFPEIAAQAASDTGMRTQICFPLMESPTPWGSGPEDYLNKGRALIRQWQDDPLVRIAIGPHAPYTVADSTLEKALALSRETGSYLQIHLHETRSEVEEALQQSGERPLQRLARLGLLTDRTQCVHMTTLDPTDIATLRQAGSHVVHCPKSNLKLASGFCPVRTLMDSGINVAIGTDGAASNNALDLFSELSIAALLAKAVSGDAATLSAHQAIAMATLNGARALGCADQLGSLTEGKQADLIAVDLSDPFTQPVYDPASHLIYSSNGRQVSHSWIAGVPQVQAGHLTRIDVPDLKLRVDDWRKRITANA